MSTNGIVGHKAVWQLQDEKAREPFEKRKRQKQEEVLAGVKHLQPLTEKEKILEQKLLKARAAAKIIPSHSFLNCMADYEGTDLLHLLRKMPKAVLHTHGIATGDFRSLVKLLQEDKHFHIWQGGGSEIVDGCIRPFAEGAPVGEGWKLASSISQERLYKYVTLPSGLPDVKTCWDEFGTLWLRVLEVGCCAPFYFGKGKYFWSILESQFAANVLYFEIKEPLFLPFTEYDGTKLTDEAWTELFKQTVDGFRALHPDFLGARLVLVCHKSQSVDEVRTDYLRAAAMKERLPDYIAGFDLAGPEDTLNPVEVYASMLEQERSLARSRGIDLPLHLHAGETNIPDASQVVDAVLIGCERIGHGFALARHPALIEDVKALGISLECCPISNQVLGYIPDLANHPALGLMRSGVPITISPDDPGMWHYHDVSFDYVAVVKAWNLGLQEVKTLARNSLAYSTLRDQRREDALAAWEKAWDKWIDECIENGHAAKS